MADFNYEGAKREGYTDSQIAEFLAKEKRFNLSGARKEGYSDTEIVQHLADIKTPPPEGMMERPSRPKRVTETPGGAAMVSQGQKGTKLVPSGDILDRAAYEGGAKLSEVASSAGAPPEVAGALGYGANVAFQAVPMVLGGEGAKVVSEPLKTVAKDLMQSAVKPTLAQLKSGEAATAIQTMLDQGINATAGGVRKIKAKIGELNDQIKEALANSTTTISKKKVADSLNEVLDRVKRQVNPDADMAAVKKSFKEFLAHPLLKDADEIPVQLAQELKQGTYREVGKKYGQIGAADVEAQKGLARGLKNEIADKVPQIAPLNAEESKLIKTLNVVERRALMELNKNPMGLSLLAGNPEAWAAFMADRSALFKSLAARMIHSGSEQVPAAAARAGIGGAEVMTGQGEAP